MFLRKLSRGTKRTCFRLLYVLTSLSVLILCSLLLFDPMSRYPNSELGQFKNRELPLFEDVNPFVDGHDNAVYGYQIEQNTSMQTNNRNSTPYLIIGISTVCRIKGLYLKTTLDSLINNTTPEERQDIKIVVAVSDLNNSCSDFVASFISKDYEKHLLNHFIELIKIPEEYYPPLENLQRTFGDSAQRVRWRSQQNVDYSYLMRYCSRKSKYYLHLEDDVISASGFVGKIKSYIDEVKDNWTLLEFSSLGFIGKLFHSEDLQKLGGLLYLYYAQMPCDFLLLYFLKLVMQEKRFIKVPTLFQHYGVHSSMPNLLRDVKDRLFKSVMKSHKGDNPPAKIWTNLRVFDEFKPEYAYVSSNDDKYFWAKSPKTGDSFNIMFEKAQVIDRIVIETGFSSKQDFARNALLQCSIQLDTTAEGEKKCSDYKLVGEFKNGRVDSKEVFKKFRFPIHCIRILITEEQTEWIALTEIAVFIVK